MARGGFKGLKGNKMLNVENVTIFVLVVILGFLIYKIMTDDDEDEGFANPASLMNPDAPFLPDSCNKFCKPEQPILDNGHVCKPYFHYQHGAQDPTDPNHKDCQERALKCIGSNCPDLEYESTGGESPDARSLQALDSKGSAGKQAGDVYAYGSGKRWTALKDVGATGQSSTGKGENPNMNFNVAKPTEPFTNSKGKKCKWVCN